jgi:deoxyribonuclease-4
MNPSMNAIGLHVSIAGGIHLAPQRAARLGCNTMQIFSHNPRSWVRKSISREEAALFRENVLKWGISPVFIHTSYLINLCSPDRLVRDKSVRLLIHEVELALELGISEIILHPGRVGKGERLSGIRHISRGLDKLRNITSCPIIVLETTAGQRGDIGDEIRWLGEIYAETGGGIIRGICLDTCHLFASGYDIRSPDETERVFEELERYIPGLPVSCIHLNDSKTPAGSRRDRHEEIGKGYIGEEGLRVFLIHPKAGGVPLILETPRNTDEDDRINIARVRSIMS